MRKRVSHNEKKSFAARYQCLCKQSSSPQKGKLLCLRIERTGLGCTCSRKKMAGLRRPARMSKRYRTLTTRCQQKLDAVGNNLANRL
ncbi:MAG: hypothetical protein EBX90_11985, partial [Betaproteobacteria bacterium]|nr:hypothetical protein [Betaproteobacteria bacterium]